MLYGTVSAALQQAQSVHISDVDKHVHARVVNKRDGSRVTQRLFFLWVVTRGAKSTGWPYTATQRLLG
jgi:hypothetical protein